MITKKIIPVGNITEEKGIRTMKITRMIAEYRLFGILLYRRELINPSYFQADYYEGFATYF
jgi:hypothetical protein